MFLDGAPDSYGVAKGFCGAREAAGSSGMAESGLGATAGAAAALVWLVAGSEKLLCEKWSMVREERGVRSPRSEWKVNQRSEMRQSERVKLAA